MFRRKVHSLERIFLGGCLEFLSRKSLRRQMVADGGLLDQVRSRGQRASEPADVRGDFTRERIPRSELGG